MTADLIGIFMLVFVSLVLAPSFAVLRIEFGCLGSQASEPPVEFKLVE